MLFYLTQPSNVCYYYNVSGKAETTAYDQDEPKPEKCQRAQQGECCENSQNQARDRDSSHPDSGGPEEGPVRFAVGEKTHHNRDRGSYFAAGGETYAESRGLIGKKMIYFIRDCKTNLVKIGFSQNVLSRLGCLQREYGKDLFIEFLCRGGRQRERQLHKKFRSLRKFGEWFEWSDMMLSFRDDSLTPFSDGKMYSIQINPELNRKIQSAASRSNRRFHNMILVALEQFDYDGFLEKEMRMFVGASRGLIRKTAPQNAEAKP
jgi:predicted transcriptional regulator